MSWHQSLRSVVLGASLSACTAVNPGTDANLKTDASQNAGPQGSGATCDLAEMDQASSEASKAGFLCAYNAASTAGALAGGWAAKLASFVGNAMDLFDASQGMNYLIGDIVGFATGAKDDASLSEETRKELERIIDRAKNRLDDRAQNSHGHTSAAYQCIRQNFETLHGVFKVYIAVQNIQGGVTSYAVVKELNSLAHSFSIQVVNGLFVGGGHCSEWLNGERNVSFQRFLKSWTKILDGMSSAMVIAGCGADIAKGGYILYQNSQCLMSDLQSYYESQERLETQNLVTLQTPASRDDTRPGYTCNGEPDGNNLFVMKKFGLWLQQQSFFSYATRTYVCADHCGNKGVGADVFVNNIESIVGADKDICSEAGVTSQTQRMIDICISYCCSQESGCAEAAREKLTNYDR